MGSILGPLLFLVYINLPNKYVKLYANVTLLYLWIRMKVNILNNDLLPISEWAYNWKMLFNPDPSKPAQEVLFSRKKKIQIHPTISLNNIQLKKRSYQKERPRYFT